MDSVEDAAQAKSIKLHISWFFFLTFMDVGERVVAPHNSSPISKSDFHFKNPAFHIPSIAFARSLYHYIRTQTSTACL